MHTKKKPVDGIFLLSCYQNPQDRKGKNICLAVAEISLQSTGK